MQRTIDETNRRREKQIAYNQKHGITPKAIRKSLDNLMGQKEPKSYVYEADLTQNVAENKALYQTTESIDKQIRSLRKKMEEAAKELDFINAAKFRDQIKILQEAKQKNN
jgi:excinuclease ABC subunit B